MLPLDRVDICQWAAVSDVLIVIIIIIIIDFVISHCAVEPVR